MCVFLLVSCPIRSERVRIICCCCGDFWSDWPMWNVASRRRRRRRLRLATQANADLHISCTLQYIICVEFTMDAYATATHAYASNSAFRNFFRSLSSRTQFAVVIPFRRFARACNLITREQFVNPLLGSALTMYSALTYAVMMMSSRTDTHTCTYTCANMAWPAAVRCDD